MAKAPAQQSWDSPARTAEKSKDKDISNKSTFSTSQSDSERRYKTRSGSGITRN